MLVCFSLFVTALSTGIHSPTLVPLHISIVVTRFDVQADTTITKIVAVASTFHLPVP